MGFCSRSGHSKDFKSSTRSFPPGAQHKRKCEGLSVSVLFVLSSNSVQSFMIGICNRLPIENGLHNLGFAPAVPIPYLYLYFRPGVEPKNFGGECNFELG